MDTIVENQKSLPLRLAYEFLIQKGLGKDVEEIRSSRDKYKSYTSTLRKGKILELLDKNKLTAEFIKKHWPFGNSEKGERKIKMYKRIFDDFQNSEDDETEEEEENIDETRFAYEEDLRDYLSSNLNVIESGLSLFKDKDGTEGVEYSVDANHKRIDILAIDKNKTPVIIELKVSQGYEKVIGQCLYYGNRIRNILGKEKVRIIIIAREITEYLRIATLGLPSVELFEYNLLVKLKKIPPQ